jgi:acylphosphatase
MADQQRIVVYRGDVQGVGFRYTACRVVGGYGVAGYVRNLSDGSVEIVAEGDGTEIDRFLAELEGNFSGYIKSQTRQTKPYTGGYASFGVRR